MMVRKPSDKKPRTYTTKIGAPPSTPAKIVYTEEQVHAMRLTLMSAIDQLQGDVDIMLRALNFYADKDNWRGDWSKSEVRLDAGTHAREALTAVLLRSRRRRERIEAAKASLGGDKGEHDDQGATP